MWHGLPRGHTLWEMLLALGLLAVIAAIVAPSIGFVRAAAKESEVERTTRDIVGVLTQARLLALERGTPIDLLLDPATGRVWIVSRTVNDRRVTAAAQLQLSPGATLLGDGPRVRFSFDAAGTASGGAVIVRGTGGEHRVTVDPWSGAPDVQSR
jgi:type II secretory pathway pseudopilin PulG